MNTSAAALTWLKSAPASRAAGRYIRGLGGGAACPSRAFGGLGAENSGGQGHANEVRQARSLHLGHQVRPVDLDRPRADPEFVCDLLVGLSGHEALEHVALAAGQRRQSSLDLTALGLALMIPVQPVEC